MKKFIVTRLIEVKDYITQEFIIEAESENEIDSMSNEDFYSKCSYGEVIGRDYIDFPMGIDKIEKIEEF